MKRLVSLCLGLVLSGCAGSGLLADAVDPSVPSGAVRITTRYWVQPNIAYGKGNPLCAEVSGGSLWLSDCANRDSQKFEFAKQPGTYVTVFPRYQIRAGLSCLTLPEIPAGFKMGDVKLGAVRMLPCVAGDESQIFAYHPQGEIITTSPKGYCVGAQEDWMQKGNVLKVSLCRNNANWAQQQILDPKPF